MCVSYASRNLSTHAPVGSSLKPSNPRISRYPDKVAGLVLIAPAISVEPRCVRAAFLVRVVRRVGHNKYRHWAYALGWPVLKARATSFSLLRRIPRAQSSYCPLVCMHTVARAHPQPWQVDKGSNSSPLSVV